jgi:hypothetical protein
MADNKVLPQLNKPSFEESIEIINIEIEKRRPKWTLTAISWMDFDDVAQLLRVHINKKWDMYDDARPLANWVNKIITHQIRNIRRNVYDSSSRPCLKCAAAESNDLCSIYVKQCNDCPLYKQWEDTKKSAHDVKLPLAMEHHTQEVYDLPYDFFDLERGALQIHNKMQQSLKKSEWLIYKYLYIDGLSEEDTARKLGFISNEKKRKPGYNTIIKARKIIIDKVRKLIREDEIDI